MSGVVRVIFPDICPAAVLARDGLVEAAEWPVEQHRLRRDRCHEDVTGHSPTPVVPGTPERTHIAREEGKTMRGLGHRRLFGGTVGALLGALLLVAFAAPPPAGAAGSPYSSGTWAGVRSYWVKGPLGDNDWRRPFTAQASWQTPCLPATFDGPAGALQGAYDQWIGLEATDDVNLIQVGVRSYHLDIWGPHTGYFAWMVNTLSPTGRTAVELFTVTCGVTMTAKVWADGAVCIAPEASQGSCMGTTPAVRNSQAAMPSPRNAAFVIERFADGTGLLPFFDRARFVDAGAAANGCCGWPIGTQSTVWSVPNNMTGTPDTNSVSVENVSQYGAVDLHQYRSFPTSYCPDIVCKAGDE
jgi:hypothetical protein